VYSKVIRTKYARMLLTLFTAARLLKAMCKYWSRGFECG